jgi:hypothetical protein
VYVSLGTFLKHRLLLLLLSNNPKEIYMGPARARAASPREKELLQLASAKSFFASQICRRHSCSNPLKLSSL